MAIPPIACLLRGSEIPRHVRSRSFVLQPNNMAIEQSNVENFDRKEEIIIKFPNNSICRHKNLIGNRDFRIFENLATLLLTLTQQIENRFIKEFYFFI